MRHQFALYRPDQVRALDQCAIEQMDGDGYVLMQRAGAVVFRTIRARWPEVRSVTVCCGGGNNGGDGWVVARLAKEAGWEVQVFWLTEPKDLLGSAQLAYQAWLGIEGKSSAQCFDSTSIFVGELIVDALLGSGFRPPVGGSMQACLQAINQAPMPVISIDVPSGLNPDTGYVTAMDTAVLADLTIEMIGRKRGLYTANARRYRGALVLADLAVPGSVFEQITPDADLMDPRQLESVLPRRLADSHKGKHGAVLVVGGSEGMAGAAILAGISALRSGSGWVRLAGGKQMTYAAIVSQPELMAHRIKHSKDLLDLFAVSNVVALGPGLGQSTWAQSVFDQGLAFDGPLVVDADGLNLLSKSPTRREHWVLTPHPGEAARLLQTTIDQIESDRFASVRALASQFNAVVVLKGAGTLVGAPCGRVLVCDQGNEGMASAGMGDALTGVIASLWAQGLPALEAAAWGVMVHALAGDAAAVDRRQILATDLIGKIPAVMALSS